MKLILIRSPQLLFYRMKSKKKIRTCHWIQLQFYTIRMSNGRIQFKGKAAGKLILKHICMETVNSYSKKMP